MKIAYFDYTLDISVRNYIDNVVRELQALGVEVYPFGFYDPLPENADVYWDPRLTGARPPTEKFKRTSKPCVATVHGIAELSLPPWEFYKTVKYAVKTLAQISMNIYRWRKWRGYCATIITVSVYDKRNIERRLFLRGENIVPIHHGVDHSLFTPGEAKKEPYFLHVSAYQPGKNVNRIIAAYRRLPEAGKPQLILVVPGYSRNVELPGLSIQRHSMTHNDLVPLYQKAMGFVFPSLHEGFGMPILEAMACGCPVITSNVSACPEVAGDAALLVNPRSVDEIANAMRRLVEEPALRQSLREKGIARAAQFTWEKSAKEHLQVFEEAVRVRDVNG